jgi:hypothetical protein
MLEPYTIYVNPPRNLSMVELKLQLLIGWLMYDCSTNFKQSCLNERFRYIHGSIYAL